MLKQCDIPNEGIGHAWAVLPTWFCSRYATWSRIGLDRVVNVRTTGQPSSSTASYGDIRRYLSFFTVGQTATWPTQFFAHGTIGSISRSGSDSAQGGYPNGWSNWASLWQGVRIWGSCENVLRKIARCLPEEMQQGAAVPRFPPYIYDGSS